MRGEGRRWRRGGKEDHSVWAECGYGAIRNGGDAVTVVLCECCNITSIISMQSKTIVANTEQHTMSYLSAVLLCNRNWWRLQPFVISLVAHVTLWAQHSGEEPARAHVAATHHIGCQNGKLARQLARVLARLTRWVTRSRSIFTRHPLHLHHHAHSRLKASG